jgi:hypothetical protein
MLELVRKSVTLVSFPLINILFEKLKYYLNKYLLNSQYILSFNASSLILGDQLLTTKCNVLKRMEQFQRGTIPPFY